MTNTTNDPKHECANCAGAGSWDEHRAGSEDWYEVRCQRCDGRGWLHESEMSDEELAAVTAKEDGDYALWLEENIGADMEDE